MLILARRNTLRGRQKGKSGGREGGLLWVASVLQACKVGKKWDWKEARENEVVLSGYVRTVTDPLPPLARPAVHFSVF